MLKYFLGKEARRKHLLKKVSPGPMKDYLSVPFPGKRTPCLQAQMLAMDFETTGLDPLSDVILSIGCVEVSGMSIRLGTAWYRELKIERDIPEETAIIHGITDDRSKQGDFLESVLPELLSIVAGKVLLVHNAAIEQKFLNAACKQFYGVPFVAPIIDTQVLAARQFKRRDINTSPGDLRLFNLREKLGLPRYKAHHALTDALATAELFLVLASRWSDEHKLKLANFY